jgi:hypothetical protein
VTALIMEKVGKDDRSFRLVFQIHNPKWQSAHTWNEDEDMPSPGVRIFFVVAVVEGTCIDFLAPRLHKLFGPSHWTIYGIILWKLGNPQEKFVYVGQFEVCF